MTTKSQVRKYLRPLLERYDDLILVDRWLCIRLVHHLARAILIDASWSQDVFRPRTAICDLSQRLNLLPLNYGEELYPRRRGGWHWSDPDSQDMLLEAIETVGLPFLRSIDTLEKFVVHAGYVPFRPVPMVVRYKCLPNAIAIGNLETARQYAAAINGYRVEDDPFFDHPKYYVFFHEIERLLAPLAAGDIPAMEAILHEFEAFSVKNLKLERYWEPTPFPLEELA